MIHEFADFPEQAEKAKKYLASFNENLLYKKIDYLEKKSALLDNKSKKNEKISEGEAFQKEALADKNTPSEEQSRASPSTIYQHWVSEKYASEVNARMALWIPVEIAYYEQWVEKNNNHGSIQEFYEEQKGQATALRGIIEAYDRPVRNKPGDYLLVNKTNRLPIAYLYSTHVNLEDKVGQEITIEGILRPNNHFAYPAYFVIRAQ